MKFTETEGGKDTSMENPWNASVDTLPFCRFMQNHVQGLLSVLSSRMEAGKDSELN